jgi:hypothetical protein
MRDGVSDDIGEGMDKVEAVPIRESVSRYLVSVGVNIGVGVGVWMAWAYGCG